MNFNDLTREEKAIIESFRKLSQSRKKAVTASLEAFKNWIKEAIPWVAATILQAAISEIFHHLISSM